MTFQKIKWQITLKWCHYRIGISYLIAAISHSSLRNYWGNIDGSVRDQSISMKTWATFQYPIRRLTVRSHKVSKPRDLYLELSDRSEICQAPRQQGCRSACQISKRYAIIWTTNLPASRLHEILRYDVLSDIETGPWLLLERWIFVLPSLIR